MRWNRPGELSAWARSIVVDARGVRAHTPLMTTTTAALLEMMAADDMEAFEAATAAEPRTSITASRSDRIESVCTWAYSELGESKAWAWEQVCRLAREGLTRWVDVVLRQERKLVAQGYEW
jgi:hypothetical protein